MLSLTDSRIRREFQHFYLNNVEISGIQSVQMQFNDNVTPIKFIGEPNTQIFPIGPKIGSVNVSYIPITIDGFLQYATGNSGFHGYLLKDQSKTGENYSFISGYITSYSHKCSINNFPENEVSISVLGNLGRISGYTELGNYFAEITGQTGIGQDYLATFGSIEIGFDDITDNRVLSYSLDILTQRNPSYSIGKNIPSNVDINYPIEVIFNCALDANSYNYNNLQNYPCKTKINNLSIVLKDHQTYEEYLRYNFNDMILIGQNYSTSIDGNVVLNLQYKTYINREVTGTSSLVEDCTTTTSTVTTEPIIFPTTAPGNTGQIPNTPCVSGNCALNSGLSFYLCSGAITGIFYPNNPDPSLQFGIGYNINYQGVQFGYLEFEYFDPCISNPRDSLGCPKGCGFNLAGCDSNNNEVITSLNIYAARLKKIVWNFDYLNLYPDVGDMLLPGITRKDVFVDNCNWTNTGSLCSKPAHTFPFSMDMGGCDFNFCIELPEIVMPICSGTTTTTTTSTTTPTTTTTTTSTTSTTSTSTTTTPTTTTTTTTTTTPTTTTTTTTTSTTSTTTTSTTTTPCPHTLGSVGIAGDTNAIDNVTYLCVDGCNQIPSSTNVVIGPLVGSLEVNCGGGPMVDVSDAATWLWQIVDLSLIVDPSNLSWHNEVYNDCDGCSCPGTPSNYNYSITIDSPNSKTTTFTFNHPELFVAPGGNADWNVKCSATYNGNTYVAYTALDIQSLHVGGGC